MRILPVQPTIQYSPRQLLRRKTRWLEGIILPSNLFFPWSAARQIAPVDFY